MPREIQDLYAYDRWASRRILDAALALPPEDLDRDLGSSFPSVRATLAHVLASDWVWLERWHGRSPTAVPAEWDLSTGAAIEARWREIEAAVQAFVERLSAADLDRVVDYRNLAGTAYAQPLDELLRHVVNHATYHRGQVVTMLRQLGATPPSTDLVQFYRERAGEGTPRDRQVSFVGVDLTSAYARRPRPVDIAILDESGRMARFSTWQWPPRNEVRSRAAALVESLFGAVGTDRGGVILAIDGPQGLAATGRSMRFAERVLGTPGRTHDTRCDIDGEEARPFAFYIESSLDLFAALREHAPELTLFGLDGGDLRSSRLFEVFPGSEWQVLAGRRLAAKSSPAGRQEREELWRRLGITWNTPHLLTADQNDALMAAFLAFATMNRAEAVEAAGEPPRVEAGDLREGFILHFKRALVDIPPAPGASTPPTDTGDWPGDGARVTFTDLGLVHGNEPENAWLRTGHDYRLRCLPPYSPVEFVLRHAAEFPGQRGWRCEPTVARLMKALRVDYGSHLSRPNRATIPVEDIDRPA